jgi:ribonuclease P protein component
MTGSSMEQTEEVLINPSAADRPFKFTRNERISQPQDFKRVMKLGRRLSSKNFVFFILRNNSDLNRLGLIVKKEVGLATFRIRMKRYLREFFRLHKRQIKGSFDIVILVKRGCSISRYFEAEEELKRALIP